MRASRGVTLIEMLIVVALLGLLVGITFPSVTAGIDSLRIASAANSVVSFLNGALNRAERLQEVVEIEITPGASRLVLRSTRPGFERELELPDGVTVRSVLPENRSAPGQPRHILVFPGGTVPRIGVDLVNHRGTRRIVRVDPATGAPQIERPEETR